MSTAEDNPFEGFVNDVTSKDEPEKSEPEKDEPEKAEPEKSEPEKAEPEKAEPEKAEPEKDEPEKDEPEKDDDSDDDDEKDLGEKARKRIGKLTKNWRSEQRRADELAGRLAAIEERLAAADKKPKDLTTETADTTSDPKQPDPKDYKFGELDAKFITDLAEWSANKAFANAAKTAGDKEKEKRDRDTAETASREFVQKYQTVRESGAKKYDDFEEVVVEGAANNEWPLSQEMATLIVYSEVGDDVAYYLASNPKFARDIYSKTPVEQAAAFGRLEARFIKPDDKKPGVKTTKAPPPLKNSASGGGGKTGAVRADTSDFAAFERMANTRE